ncbi:MAG: SDR family NAD(P)-dependent oxidoreductase [Actinomycetota bacterium]
MDSEASMPGDRWRGQVWVITGASSGIGARTARDVAAGGAIVVAAARREERIAALVAGLPGEGHSYRVTDVSDREQVRAVAEYVDATYGRCDVLLNNAGFLGAPGFGGERSASVDDVEAVMATNFFGAVYCTAEFLDLLKRSAPSHIVNVTSVAGRLAAPGQPAYTASKFALVGWTESLQPDLARKGIYLSSVEPGFIPTEGFPQKGMIDDPMMSRLLGTDAQVSDAIQDAVAHRKAQRVVPRWYYTLQVPRVVAPRLYRIAAEKLATARNPRR